jgi:MFS family permease
MPEHETQATALLPLDAETQKQLSLHGLEVNSDGYIDWAKNSPSHPQNWSVRRKAYDIGLIIFLDFFTTGVSAGGTPASTFALDDFHIGSTLGIFAFASIYLVGQGLGGLLFSPYSETFGRRALYMWSALFYSLFCILVAAAPNIGAVFAGRFITGFLSAIPSVIVSGSIEDLFDTEARIWMFFAWSVIVNLSLVIGPLLAFYIANALNWYSPPHPQT